LFEIYIFKIILKERI